MRNLESSTRNALALLIAAAAAFVGGAVLVKAGRGFPQLTGGQAAQGQPGIPLLAIVFLLAACGVLLVVMAGKELLDQRRRGRSAR